LLVLVECHLAYPLVPWVDLLVVRQMMLVRHLLVLLFLCQILVHVLVQKARVWFVGTLAAVAVPRTAFDVQLEEVHQRTLVLLVLHCMLYVVGPPGTAAAVARIVVEVHTVLLRSLPAVAGDAR
jgi:hypothetical protein